MARNGSGTYTRVNTFVAGNAITAAGHNQNWADLETEMTNSVAADGQTTITGPIKFSVGSAAAPALVFTGDTDTGLYRSAANETGIAAEGVRVATFGTATTTFYNSVVVSGTAVFTTGIAGTATFFGGVIVSATSQFTGPIIASGTAQFVNGLIASATATFSAPIIASATCTFTVPMNFKSFPPPASFKNLVIKVASNTTITVTADFVASTDGTNFQTTAVNSTINMATTGADALDAGSIAQATTYFVFVVAKADGTTKCVASTSATAPTMPSGYAYKARVGAVRTASGSANLMGTWQFGRRAQYIVGLAQTTVPVNMTSGVSGTIGVGTLTSVSISSFVPSTAGVIHFYIGGSNSITALAPNNSYGSTPTNLPPANMQNSQPWGQQGSFIIESSNVFYYGNTVNSFVNCMGWEDNI